jgi:hypothetical protein
MEKYTDAKAYKEITINWVKFTGSIEEEFADYWEELETKCDSCKEYLYQLIENNPYKEIDYCNNPKCKEYLEIIN